MSDADILLTQLTDLAEGRLDPAQAAQVRARIAADPQLAADYAWLETAIGLMRNDAREGADAPDYVINRALRLIRPPAPQPDPLRRLVAMLRFDSFRQALAPGMRADAASQRQLLYTADGCDIDLRVSTDGDLRRINGQILGSDAPGAVIVRRAGAVVAEAPLNPLSEFSLPPLPAGTYALTVRLDTLEVIIEGLDLS
jgi:hypothetical protein